MSIVILAEKQGQRTLYGGTFGGISWKSKTQTQL